MSEEARVAILSQVGSVYLRSMIEGSDTDLLTRYREFPLSNRYLKVTTSLIAHESKAPDMWRRNRSWCFEPRSELEPISAPPQGRRPRSLTQARDQQRNPSLSQYRLHLKADDRDPLHKARDQQRMMTGCPEESERRILSKPGER